MILALFPSQNIEPVLRETPNLFEFWMLLVLLLILGIIAYVRVVYFKRLNRLFRSLWRIQILRQVMREELVFSHRASVLLHFNFVLVTSLIIYCWMMVVDLKTGALRGIFLYLAIALSLLGIYIFKLILNALLRRIFRDPGVIREYLFEVFLINKAGGIILLPLVIALIFTNIGNAQILLLTALSLLLLFLVFRFVQGFRLTLNYRLSGIYIILYLCTLEILPFMVFSKMALFQ